MMHDDLDVNMGSGRKGAEAGAGQEEGVGD